MSAGVERGLGCDCDPWARFPGLMTRCVLLEKDIDIERDRSKRWQQLAGRYDDIRDWLRLCDDNPEGHAEFYRQCCLLIFGQYRDETGDDE